MLQPNEDFRFLNPKKTGEPAAGLSDLPLSQQPFGGPCLKCLVTSGEKDNRPPLPQNILEKWFCWDMMASGILRQPVLLVEGKRCYSPRTNDVITVDFMRP